MDLASLSLFSLLHLGSAIVSLALSSEVFLKNRKSPSHQQFFIWGLVSSAYLIALFFTLNASSADEAILLFRFSNQLYFVSIGLLAYLVHNLEPQRQQAWLILVAPMLAVSAALLIPYDARLTELGWSVDARPIITVEGIVVFVYLAGYSVLVATDLYHMMRKAGAPWLTRKYGIMLFSFVGLQIVGVVLLNALKLVVQGIPYVAGILYFFGLSALWYSFKMQQPKEVKLSGAQRGFTDSYARFMSRFLDVAPSDELGLKTVNLLEYLDKTRLRDYVTYDRLRIILNVDKMERLDNIQALDKTMEYLESKEWSSKLSDPFMDVLENVHQNMIETQETLEPFKEVLLSHQDFLKRTDIIYGFSRGQFLEFIGPDDSLGDRPEWEVALRMYKRWLLPIRMFLVGDIASEFYKMLRSTDVVKYLDISPEGEIGIDRVLSHIEALPQERRAEAVRVGFDALMSWVAQNLAAKDSASFIKWLKLVRKTTLLNSGARGVQKTFASLIARLSKDV